MPQLLNGQCPMSRVVANLPSPQMKLGHPQPAFQNTAASAPAASGAAASGAAAASLPVAALTHCPPSPPPASPPPSPPHHHVATQPQRRPPPVRRSGLERLLFRPGAAAALVARPPPSTFNPLPFAVWAGAMGARARVRHHTHNILPPPLPRRIPCSPL